jgi:CheY-like chemotaxis protein
MKILVIEDEILIQKSLQKLLKRGGADVHVTASGIEAIEMINENNYDKVICDLMLKDITGFDIIEESRKKYQEDEISELFIIITAYSSPQVLDKAKAYGCMIVNKPFKSIQETINLFLGKL